MSDDLANISDKDIETAITYGKKAIPLALRCLRWLTSGLQPNAKILVTGIPTVGKTCLGKYVSTYSAGRQSTSKTLPGTSKKVEHFQISVDETAEKNPTLIVTFGQETEERVKEQALPAFDGWIHVASYGYTSAAWDAPEPKKEQQIRKFPNIESLRQHVLLREEKEIEIIANMIRHQYRNAHSRSRSWGIVVYTKVDLYLDDEESARKYYSPDATNAFTRPLNSLREDIGKDWFLWNAVPMCSTEMALEYNGQKLRSRIDEHTRNHYTNSLLQQIGTYVEWTNKYKP